MEAYQVYVEFVFDTLMEKLFFGLRIYRDDL